MKTEALERFFRSSLFGRLERYAGRSFGRDSKLDVYVAYVIIAASFLIFLCTYIAVPTEPFGYWRDLGFAHETAAGAVYTVHSFTDAVDSVGWTPWFNAPLFLLNSNVSEAIIAAVTWLAGDAWLAIKIVQVLEVIVAATAAFAMFLTYSRSKFWATVFGITYAVLPVTALSIRGNPAFGWLVALAPAAMAGGTFLIRKFGMRAIPLVGFVCGAVGYGIALQYAILSSLPIFALIIAGERRSITRIGWVTFVPLGLLCCAAMGAYYALPSFSSPILSDAAARAVSLTTGAFLVNFSETWPGLLTLIPREAYVSPFPDYNVETALPHIYVFGGIVWMGAIATVLWTKQRRASWATFPAVAIVASCVILSLGTAIPFGQVLWNTLFLLPHLNAIRTPDRFLLLPSLMVPFWYVCALERYSATLGWTRRVAGWISIAVALSLISFDVSQHCFAVEPTMGFRQPEINEVRRVVEAEGGKTISFAGVNGAYSFDDASEYGVPQPFAPVAPDLASRFLEDGNGAVGILGRMGVRTVISAPNWTTLSAFPNTANIYRRLRSARLIFKSREDVFVSRIAARPDVSAQAAMCVYGGPGGFDLLDHSKALRNTAFLEPNGGCSEAGFVNFDLRDAWKQHSTIESWSGSELLRQAPKILDADYPFVPNRSLLDVPWYRNSIDGDRPVFDSSGAINIATGQELVLPSRAQWPAGSAIALRLSIHAGGNILIMAGTNLIANLRVPAKKGFQWYEARTTALKPSDTSVSILFTVNKPNTASQGNAIGWSGIALDGAMIYDRSVHHQVIEAKPAFVAISLNRFPEQPGPPHGIDLASTRAYAPDTVATSMHYDTYETVPVWLADAAVSRLRLTWNGKDGFYVVSVRAVLTKAGDSIGIDADSNGSCCRFAEGLGVGYSGSVEGRFHLHRGSHIDAKIISPAFDAASANRIISLNVIPVDRLRLPDATSYGSSGAIDFAKPPYASLSQLSEIRGVRLAPPLAYGAAGSRLSANAILSGHPKSAYLEIEKVGAGYATATLRCDAMTRQVPLTEDDMILTLNGAGFSRCSAQIAWSSGNLAIRRIRLGVGGASWPPSTARWWLPAGTYKVSMLLADGSESTRPDFASSGCSGSEPVCNFPTAFWHNIELRETSSTARILLFTNMRGIGQPPKIDVVKTAALRWQVSLKTTSTVSLTQIYDGNWILSNYRHTYAGQRCDISNTCFTDVPAGSYELYHRWPTALRTGILISAGTLIIPLLLLCLRLGAPSLRVRPPRTVSRVRPVI